MSIETQTEAFMDRPPSPLFVPAKTGVDADTQVVVGELFEFDLEVWVCWECSNVLEVEGRAGRDPAVPRLKHDCVKSLTAKR